MHRSTAFANLFDAETGRPDAATPPEIGRGSLRHCPHGRPFDLPSLDGSNVADGSDTADAAGTPIEPSVTLADIPVHFDDSQLAAACAHAHAAGHEAASKHMAARLHHDEVQALAVIGDLLAAADTAHGAALGRHASTTAQLALAVAGAVIPAALERQPIADIEVMLRACLARHVTAPDLVVSCSADLVPILAPRLAELVDAHGYRGRVRITDNADLRAGDARISWSGGQAERHLDALISDIHEQISRGLAAQTVTAERTEPELAAAANPETQATDFERDMG